MFEYRMHITPDTYLHTLTEKDCVDYLYITPVGEKQSNEMSDVHYIKDAFVPYHEHSRGYETFSIDGGSVEVTINGKRCVVEQGDLIHIEPFVSHGFRFLEEGTIWRELFQEMDMYGGIMQKSLIKRSFPEKLEDDGFMAKYRLGHHTVRLGEPEAVVVPKAQVPQVRPKGGALARFRFGGIACSLKVGRWETGGEKEIWELAPDKGVTIEWNEPHPNWDLFVVKEGSVQVEAAGERFAAKARDIVNIPPYTAHKLTVLEEGTVLHAYNVKSLLLRLLEDLETAAERTPEKLRDEGWMKALFERCDCHVTGFSRA